MVRFDVARTELVFGALLGGPHALWAGVVASGWGQWLLDLISGSISSTRPTRSRRSSQGQLRCWSA